MTTPTSEIGGYQLIRELGRGGLGVVYLAKHLALGRPVALKRIRASGSGGPESLARLQREARALARLDHPHIVRVYDLVHAGPELWLAMEYVPGPTLRRALERHHLSPPQSLRVLEQISAALAYAGRIGIIHRDLKPENVFLTEAGDVKLGDFGLARLTAGEQNFATRAGSVLGTPSYMSPEQARGATDIDVRADVYALGVLTFELFLGRPPFQAAGTGHLSVLEAQISVPPPRPTSLQPGFPPALERVILQALEKQRGRRPASAGVFWNRLQELADEAWPRWREDDQLSVHVTEVSPAPTEPLPAAIPTLEVGSGFGPPAPAGESTVLWTSEAGMPLASAPDPAALPRLVRSPPPLKATMPVLIAGRRPRRWLVPPIIGALAVMAVAAYLGYQRLFVPPSSLEVTAVTVAAQPATGVYHCVSLEQPSATMVLVGTISTNGA